MLEKPDFPDEKIIACLRAEFGLIVSQFAFLPLGNDMFSAVYRAVSDTGAPYFVKLRSGVFDEMAVEIPKLLHDQGIAQIIAPVATRTGQLRADLEAFKVILYPFVAGHDGFTVNLSEHHWIEFGRALKSVHTTALPPAIKSRLPKEMYSPQWREMAKAFLARAASETFTDPAAIKCAALLNTKQAEINEVIRRAERLSAVLQAAPPEFTLCHADIHVGNVLLADDGGLYLVDWDNPILAPKERDLMFIGGGLGGGGHTPQEEERLFYQGYGQTSINPVALAYYRYERIIQDISAFCYELLSSGTTGEDRERGFGYLKSNFAPNGVLDLAYQTEQSLPPELRS